MRTRPTPVRFLLATVLAATACGGPITPINVSLQEFPQNVRIGDALEDPGVIAPIPPTAPRLTGGLVPPAPPVPAAGPPPPGSAPEPAPPPPPPPPSLDTCPEAKPGVTPLLAAGTAVELAPAPAIYTYRTGGKHTVGGSQADVVDYPETGTREVSAARAVTNASFDYDVTVTLGSNRTVTTYRVVLPSDELAAPPPGLFVVSIQTLDDAGTVASEFNPTPPMTVLPFPADPGTTFSVLSTDLATGMTVAYNGLIGDHVVVDACGAVIDTREVTHTGSISIGTCGSFACLGADSSRHLTTFSATYDIAPQYGGLSVQDVVNVQGHGLDAPFNDDLTGVISSVPLAPVTPA